MKRPTFLRAIGLCLALCLALTGCGATDASTGTATASAAPTQSGAAIPQTTDSPAEQTGYGYQVELSDFDESGAHVERMFQLDDEVYLDASVEDGGRQLFRLADGKTEKTPMPVDSAEILAIAPDSDGFWYCVSSADGTSVVKGDIDGNEVETVSLAADSLSPLAMAVGGDGYFYLMEASQVLVFSTEGKQVSTLPLGDGQYAVGVLRTTSGQVVLDYWTTEESGSRTGCVALLNTESIGSSLTAEQVAYSLYGGWDDNVLLSGGGNLYVLNLTSGEMTALLGWIDTNVNPDSVTAVVADSEKQVYLATGTETEEQIGTLTQVPADQLQEKTTLNVGLGAVSAALRAQLNELAVEFNRDSDSYRIHMVDYSVYDDGADRLKSDVGDLDLVISPDSMGSDGFMDLTELFDDTVGEDTLMPGVLANIKSDSGVYGIPLYFTVETTVGSSTLLGDTQGWTPADFLAAVQSHTDLAAIQFCNAYDTLDTILSAAGNATTDYASLLQAASLLPVDETAMYALAANTGGDAYACVQNGTLLLAPVTISSFMDLKTMAASVGDTMVLKGYPTDSGNGALLSMSTFLGISEKSKNADGAWEVLESILSGSRDVISQQTMGFPVLKSDFDAMAGEAMQGIGDASDSAEDGKLLVWVDGNAVEVSPFTQKEIDAFADYCSGVSGTAGCSDTLLDSARAALKQVIEDGKAPADAAKKIKS